MKNFSLKIWQFILICLAVIIIMFVLNPVAFSHESFFLFLVSVAGGGFLLFFRNKFKYLNNKTNSTLIILVIILFVALFAPIIVIYEPGQILNAGECKLLPPFSKKVILYKRNEGIQKSEFEKIVADSFKVKENIVVYRKSRIVELEKNMVLLEGGSPKVQKALFILGTDELGRDLFSRVIYGTRLSLTIGFSSTFFSMVISFLFAFASFSRSRFLDFIANRTSEIFLAIPSLFVIIFAISFFGNNLFSVILMLAITSWMSLFKILNGEIKRIVYKDFIVSSKMLGISKNKIFFREIIPLILPSIIVNMIFQIANFIIIESSLSFLGLGPGGDYVSWGSIIESGTTYLSDAWWLILFPGVFLFFTIVALNKTGIKLEKYFNPLVR